LPTCHSTTCFWSRFFAAVYVEQRLRQAPGIENGEDRAGAEAADPARQTVVKG
jgi:hypothetical protein